MSRLARVLGVCSRLLGLLPGLAVLKGGMTLPGGREALFVGAALLGATALLLVSWLYEDKLVGLARGTVVAVAASLMGVGLALWGVYAYLARLCIIRDGEASFVLPLWPSGELKDLIDQAGGRGELLIHFQPGDLQHAIDQAPGGAIAAELLLLTLMVVIFACMCGAFIVLGMKLVSQLGSKLDEEKASNE